MENGITFLRKNEFDQRLLAIPEFSADRLIKETHESLRHPERNKIHQILVETCTLKNINWRINTIIKECDPCQKNKPLNYGNNSLWTSHKPKKILEKISLNLMGPRPTARGGTHFILAVVDTFSKYIKLYALKKPTIKAIIRRLEMDNIPEIGKPDEILNDNGTQFMAKLWKDKMEDLRIGLCYATKYHTQSKN